MANKQTTAHLKDKDGEILLQQNATDSPLIPINQLERLHNFRPDLVDWVIQQTQIEAEHRRHTVKIVNRSVFIERVFGQFCALSLGLAAIIGGVYAAINGAETAGGIIATAGVGGLAAVFLTGKKQDN
ncbi:hypothetical protein [Agitococcus lubricus]|uniref:Uncharacterized protein n=1 Tax=Agitococcus lubricus TaxID=1077255 RepID=A0A2T5IYR0_9GAMM|nr:hypothetical protein [Agitococcus lubricus]PTQ89139.1 hypothetical protein C8N29_10820 [Agitococcus lubricus]